MLRVLIDLEGRCLCPIHGPQPGEYEAGRAACGCEWVALRGGLLGVQAAQVQALSHDLALASAVGHKANDIALVAETRKFAV